MIHFGVKNQILITIREDLLKVDLKEVAAWYCFIVVNEIFPACSIVNCKKNVTTRSLLPKQAMAED